MSDATPAGQTDHQPAKGRRLWLTLPLLVFLALAMLFYTRLGAGDPSHIPSALLNRPVPEFSLPPLKADGEGLSSPMLAKGVHVVNVWASWCGPCRLEHPVLMELAQDKRFQLAGINQKDVPENALRFLGALGDPFARIGVDRNGGASIDWGVYGVPETFIVKDGSVVHKHVGPLSGEILAADFMPALEKALSGS